MTLEQNPEKAEPELRLRSKPVERPFHVVLVEPEIPPNTGNVARLCAATRSPLHLVGKLGFRIDEHAVRRAGLDYWHLVDVRTHETLADAERAIDAELPFGRVPRRYFFSGHATRFERMPDIAFDVAKGSPINPLQQIQIEEMDSHDNIFPDIDLNWWM